MPSATIHPTSSVSPAAELGRGVVVGAYTVIHANVRVGHDSFVDSHCAIGAPTHVYYSNPPTYEPPPCEIGSRSIIRTHGVVYAGATIGDDFSCGHHVTIREGVRIGTGVQIGTSCDVQPDVSVGDHARLHSNVFVARGSRIEELTWVFPRATLIDDPHPPSDSCTRGPVIRRFAVVGASSVIFSGVEIGEGAVVGALSLVRADVAPGTAVVGIPAEPVGPASDIVCREGRLERPYPWWQHFRRGYPDGVLPPLE